MRLLSLIFTASLLTSAPGCAVLAVPPLAGIAGGTAIGAARQSGDKTVSVTNHAIVGGVIGVVVDAVLLTVAFAQFAYIVDNWE